MSDDGRVYYWSAQSAHRPQWQVHLMVAARPGGRWTVRLFALDGVCEDYEADCASAWEAAQEVWEILAAMAIIGEWRTPWDRHTWATG